MGRLPVVFCCRDGDETGELHLGDQREKRRSVGSLPHFLGGVACGLADYTSWIWGTEKEQPMEEGSLEGEEMWDSQEMGAVG